MAQELPESQEVKPTYDLLKEDDVEKIDIKKEDEKLDLKDDTVKEDEVKEEKEVKEDEVKPDEELEIAAPVKRKEILAKYPNLFKDFPYLERAYYKAQQFNEIFPSLDDAREATERLKTLDTFETQLQDGNSEELLKSIREADSNAFGKLVDNYLPALQKADQNAYYHVIGNIVKSTIVAMVNEAKRSSNEDLQKAALTLNQFVFGESEFKPAGKFGPDDKGPSDEQKKFEEEKNQYVQERFDHAREDLDTRVTNIVGSTINDNIDPKGLMTPQIKSWAVKEVSESLDSAIESDEQFKSVIDRLWSKAAEENFSKISLDKIKAAWLGKAKQLLPALIQTSRNNALKGLGRRVKEDKDRTGPIVRGNPSSDKKDESGPKRGQRTVDYFLQED